jgi:hypothetical protein
MHGYGFLYFFSADFFRRNSGNKKRRGAFQPLRRLRFFTLSCSRRDAEGRVKEWCPGEDSNFHDISATGT